MKKILSLALCALAIIGFLGCSSSPRQPQVNTDVASKEELTETVVATVSAGGFRASYRITSVTPLRNGATHYLGQVVGTKEDLKGSAVCPKVEILIRPDSSRYASWVAAIPVFGQPKRFALTPDPAGEGQRYYLDGGGTLIISSTLYSPSEQRLEDQSELAPMSPLGPGALCEALHGLETRETKGGINLPANPGSGPDKVFLILNGRRHSVTDIDPEWGDVVVYCDGNTRWKKVGGIVIQFTPRVTTVRQSGQEDITFLGTTVDDWAPLEVRNLRGEVILSFERKSKEGGFKPLGPWKRTPALND